MLKLNDVARSALFQLVVRDHGGCDEEVCHIAQAINDGDDYQAIYQWSFTGAADEQFKKIYARFAESIYA